MTNDVAPMKMSKAFAHLNPNVNKLGGGISGGFSSINYKGKVLSLKHQGQTYPFTREDDGTPLSFLDVIIVGCNPNKSRTYFPPWEGGDSSGSPLCAAVDGIKPDPGVPQPQAKTCAVCPHSGWTTLPSGRKGKECQEHKRLAVLLMPKLTIRMLGSPLKEPVFLKIPPASLTPIKTYGDFLQHQGLSMEAVLTRIQLDQTHLFRFNFTCLQVLSDKEAPLVVPLISSPLTLRITGEIPDVQEVVEEEPEVAPEPTVRIETGLLEAFQEPEDGAPAKPAQAKPAPAGKRGRPPKAAPVLDLEPVPQAEAAENGSKSSKWKDASTALTQSVDALLDKKIADMLPK